MTVPAEDSRLRLAYDEGLRLLDQQRDDLECLRTRAVSIASVASVSAGLLLGLLGREPHRSVWLVVGLIAFAIVLLAVGVILAPQTQTTANDPRLILSGFVDGGYDGEETLRWLAEYSGRHAEANRSRVNWLAVAFLVGLAALALMVVFLAVAVVYGR